MSKSPAQIQVEALRQKQLRDAELRLKLAELEIREAELILELEAVDLPAMDRNSKPQSDIPDQPTVDGGWRKPRNGQ